MSHPSELRFFGNYEELIDNDLKLVTLREKPKGFPPVTKVTGKISEDAESPAVDRSLLVISEESRPLYQFHLGILLLDGFLNLGQAVDIMSQIYSHRTWDEASEASSIFFLREKTSQKYENYELQLLGHQKQEESFGRLDTLVYPAWYYWLVEEHGVSQERYPEELKSRGIIGDFNVNRSLEFLEESRKAKKKDDKDWFFWHYILTG